MKRILAITLVVFGFLGVNVYANTTIKMATTTSIENSGLLDYLLPEFEKDTEIKVHVISVGTGKAIKLGESGDVDMILVHAKEAEEVFVLGGFGIDRKEVMYNDFIILGPKNDPAGIKKSKSVASAFIAIANNKNTFVSRGDDSGTHKKEMSVWKLTETIPKDDWYLETGQGMGATIVIANEKQGYILCDRGTFIAYKDKIDLINLFEGDELLLNLYGIIAVNPGKHTDVKYKEVTVFIKWITSKKGQELIGNFRKNDMVLFHPIKRL